jgi:hypothetical protein
MDEIISVILFFIWRGGINYMLGGSTFLNKGLYIHTFMYKYHCYINLCRCVYFIMLPEII